LEDQIEGCNQIFTRDIGFVIGDIFVKANILPDREEELEAISTYWIKMQVMLLDLRRSSYRRWRCDVIQRLPFVGLSRDGLCRLYARTNEEGVDWLRENFPDKKVVSLI
jgi:N-dimethylarginine dimethylaminohydrolase